MQASVSDHRFATIADAKAFALAGNAIITLQSLRTGAHFTYKVRAAKNDQGYYVSLLSGPDNESDYSYLGMIRGGIFGLTKASRVSLNTPSVRAFEWFWNMVRDGIATELVVRHEGRCGRCGRTLTVPESIDRGIGPECAGKMGGAL
jgi:hypothetical protein